jgi:hypothetical protein
MNFKLQPFDAITFYNIPPFWNIPLWAAVLGIQNYQLNYFGRGSDFHTTHVEIYFDDDHIVDAVPPAIKWDKLKDLDGCKIKVWRPTFRTFSVDDADRMVAEFEKNSIYLDDNGKAYNASIIGSKYDIGQLVNIAVNGMLDYPNTGKVSWFDAGKDKKVCSVVSRLAYEHFRKLKEAETGTEPYRRLFSIFNAKKFESAESRDWDRDAEEFTHDQGVYVEQTTPAHFSNPNYFSNEFALVYSSF